MRGRARLAALAIAALDIIGVAVLGATLTAAALVGYLLYSPLPIDFLASPLQARLASIFPALTLTPTSVVLRLDRGNGRMAVSIQGLKISGDALAQQATIERIDVALSPWDLLRGEVSLDEIAAEGAMLQLIRSPSGKLSLRAADESGTDPVSTLTALLTHLDHRTAKLPGFSLSNAKLLLPATSGAAPADVFVHRLAVTLSDNHAQLTIDAAIQTRTGAGRLIAAASVPRPGTKATFQATMTALSPSILEHWVNGTPAWLPPVISGGIDGAFDVDTGHATGKFTILAPSYDIASTQQARLPIANLQIAGRIDTAIPMLVVESLYADVGAGRITAAALMTDISSGPHVKININAQDLQLADLAPLLAADAAPPNMRGIVTSLAMQMAGSVSPAGLVVDPASIRCKADLSAGRLEFGKTALTSIEAGASCDASAIQIDLLQGRFTFPEGPPLDNIRATGAFALTAGTDQTVALRITSATSGSLKIANGTFSIRLGASPLRLDVDLPFSGTPAAVLDVLGGQSAPLREAAQSIQISGGSAHGHFALTASGGPARASLDLDLKNAQLLSAPLPAFTVEAAKLRYADDRLQGAGQLSIAGSSTNFELDYDCRSKGADITAQLSGELNMANLPSPLNALRDRVSGTLRHQLKFRQAAGAEPSLAIDVDLANAGLDVPAIRWRKPARSPGSFRTVAYHAANGTWRFEQVRLNAADMTLAGSAVLQPDGEIRHVRLSQMRYGGPDGTQATAEYSRDPGRPARLTIAADHLDARPFIEEPSLIDRPTEINVRAASMRITDKGAITSASVQGRHDGAAWTSLKAEGAMSGGGALRLQLENAPGQPAATVYADNAGSFLALLMPSVPNGLLSGGEIAITLDRPYAAGDTATNQAGRIAIRELLINKAMPLPASMRRILSLADFSDLLRQPRTRIPAAEARFIKHGPVLRLSELFAYTDAIAFMASGAIDMSNGTVDATGEIAPYEIVQRLVAQAPFTGAFVSSADKSGLVSVPFTLTGSLASPDFSAGEALQSIQPGRLRDLVKTVSRPLDLSIERRLPPPAGSR